MIDKFVQLWEKRKDKVREMFAAKHPSTYEEIVRAVVSILHGEIGKSPDPNRIVQIDHGDYQGTMLFVIAATGSQPREYWYVFVDYGSCYICDTLEAINNCSTFPPTEEQINDYMTSALHILQGLKEMN